MVVGIGLALPGAAHTQAALQPVPATPPTAEQVRAEMSIPSRSNDLRGQRDSIGYASRASQMARVWDLAATGPPPDSLGPTPARGIVGVICPHDDYIYAGRVYRKVLPLITAKTVVLVGVFHRYRRFAEHDHLVFDTYKAWGAPDGPVPISDLREDLIRRLPREDVVQSAAMHDTEHSLEALVYWLRHVRPDLEIVPIIVPSAGFDRLQQLADTLGGALAEAMEARGWQLGRDVAIAISTDGVHYGPDFKHVTFGDGGVKAYTRATARDVALLRGPLTGHVTTDKVRELYATFVNPKQPDEYRLTWCGRYAVPTGLMLLDRLTREHGGVIGNPLAYATSVGWPELPVHDIGLGETAPSNLYHFVGYPAVAFTLAWSNLPPGR